MARSRRQVKVNRPIPITVKVKFLVNCDPQDGSSIFKAGSIRELPPASANRWIRRGMAEAYKPKAGRPPVRQKATAITEKKNEEEGSSGTGTQTPTA